MKFLCMAFLSTLALFNAVKADLASRRYAQPADFSAPAVLSTNSADPKLIERIVVVSNKEPGEVIENLRLTQNRVAIIAPAGDDYANNVSGTIVTSRRVTDFAVVLLDKDFSTQTGQLAASTSTPGMLTMKDLTVKALTERSFKIMDDGKLFIVACEPLPGGPVTLEWKEKGKNDLVGRECWTQPFRAHNAGEVRIPIGRV
jgi:hypothetical protein